MDLPARASGDYELQSLAEADGAALTTVTLTLSGSPAFCEAFREEFEAQVAQGRITVVE